MSTDLMQSIAIIAVALATITNTIAFMLWVRNGPR